MAKETQKITAAELACRLQDRTASVGVIGLGYVGLPLAQAAVDAGYRVTGFDIDPVKVEMLRKGESYLKHLPSKWLAPSVADATFTPTCDMERLSEPDVLVICVPTPVTDSRDPDLSYITSTTQDISRRLRAGQLISLESTTYPGTTRSVVLPMLERSGLQCGREFFLAYSPEREDPGNAQFHARTIPKLVGGIDAKSARLANSFYSQVVTKTIPVSSCEVAEAAKILENTYRAVNIAMVNELKVLFSHLGIDVWEVIDAAKTKPFGFQAFYPGPGLGGHCIPVDPFYLSWLAKRNDLNTRFIELAGEVNREMPNYVVQQLVWALNQHGKPVNGSKVLLLGLAYKKDVDDTRESPSFKLFELLQAQGAELTYNDPHVPVIPRLRAYDLPPLKSQPLTSELLAQQDCVLIATDHSCYDYEFIVHHARLVIDTRNATQDVVLHREKIHKA